MHETLELIELSNLSARRLFIAGRGEKKEACWWWWDCCQMMDRLLFLQVMDRIETHAIEDTKLG
jgi:hypothetical protein